MVENHQLSNGSYRSQDHWSGGADAYVEASKTISYSSVKDIVEMADELLPLDNPDNYILDDGTGSGAVSMFISEKYPSIPILATDLSIGMLEKVEDLQLKNVDTLEVDGLDLNPAVQHAKRASERETFSHVFSTFMHQFTSDPMKVVEEAVRVARYGGFVGIATWGNRLDPPTVLHEALKTIDPSYEATVDIFQNDNFPREEDSIRDTMEQLGLKKVKTRHKLVHLDFSTADAFINYFSEGHNGGADRIVKAFLSNHKVDRERVKEAVRQIAEKNSRWQHIYVDAILCVGIKAR